MNKNVIIGIGFVIICAAVLPAMGQVNVDQQKPSANGRGPTDTWPMFRYDPGNTGYTTSGSPQMSYVAWKHQITSVIYASTPILSGDKLYVSTGWIHKQRAKLADPLAPRISAVEYLKDLLESQSGVSTGVYCLDAKTGAQLWADPMMAPLDPAVVSDKVYVTDMDLSSYMSDLYCLDAQTGSTVWQKQIDELVLSPTIVADNKLYVGTLDFYTYQGTCKCLDLNGNQQWSYTLNPYETIWFSAPAVSDGYVYFSTYNIYSGGGRLCCLNAATGQFVWSQSVYSGIPYFYFLQDISPVCAQGRVFAVDLNLYADYAYLKCFNSATGSLLWSHPFPSAIIPISTPAVTGDGVFILGSSLSYPEGWLYALYPGNGTTRWTLQVSGSDYLLLGSPICSSDKVIIAPQLTTFIGCFDQKTGETTWEYSLDNESFGFPAVSNNRVYVTDIEGKIYAFEDMVRIQSVSGGLFGVHAKIQSIGSAATTNVTWSITATGGVLNLIDRTTSGIIKEIPMGGSATVRLLPLIGVGKIDVIVSVHLPNTNSIQVVKHGLILGFLTILTS